MEQTQLAILGGTPAVSAAAPSWPGVNDRVTESIARLLAEGTWGNYDGQACQELSQRIASLTAHRHAMLVASGTIAVELALRGLRIEAGDEVILAGYDFPGNFRAIEAVGAMPVLVDLASDSWTIDATQIVSAASSKTRAIIVSHLHGTLADTQAIRAICDQHGWLLLEDACQAPGAKIDGAPVGSFGDVSVLSFGGSKLLSAGRGGAICTSSDEILQRLRVYCDRGNHAFPLSQLQSAAVLPQLDDLAELTARRHVAANHLRSLVASQSLLVAPRDRATDLPAYYKLAWWLSDSIEATDRAAIFAAVRAEGIAIDEGFRGFAKRTSRRCRVAGSLEQSARAADRTVLMHHPALLEASEKLDQIAHGIQKVLDAVERGDWPRR